MGSIRGRVRVHVPKDRRGTREKVYGGSTGSVCFHNCCLACTFTSHLTLFSADTASSDSPVSLTLLPLFGSSTIPGLAFHLLVSFDRFLFLAPEWLTLTRCILRHWNNSDEYYVTRSGATHTRTKHIDVWQQSDTALVQQQQQQQHTSLKYWFLF